MAETRGRVLELTMRDGGEVELIPEHDANFWASVDAMARHMELPFADAMDRLEAGEQLTGILCLYRFRPSTADSRDEVIATCLSAMRRAANVTTREDDPANLPPDVLNELWAAISVAESAAPAIIVAD